eukprot:TRINITY_DN5419_c0_g1_i2.p2 TRINITY_DN5419_c0_g1~~TRINITY_DN5419_c0_g1_i2.p2  ORF type:complete len:116 (-),score=6.44 TRINITY_DN5419_c0_g1_i2:65-412(-)
MPSLVGSEMCIRDRYQRRVHGKAPFIEKKKTKIMETPCHHKYHVSCLTPWMNIKLECPTCRARLPPLEQTIFLNSSLNFVYTSSVLYLLCFLALSEAFSSLPSICLTICKVFLLW